MSDVSKFTDKFGLLFGATPTSDPTGVAVKTCIKSACFVSVMEFPSGFCVAKTERLTLGVPDQKMPKP